MNYATPDIQLKCRRLWISALRSDQYEQAIARLRVGNRYDVLGVICNELREIVSGSWQGSGFIVGGEFRDLGVPNPIMELTGLNHCEGRFNGDSLTMLNDSGMNFRALADVIEQEPEGLFVREEVDSEEAEQ